MRTGFLLIIMQSLNAEIRPQAGLALPGAPIQIGYGTETALSQLPSHIHVAYSYIHGDWVDAPVSGGVATNFPTGANSVPNDIAFLGCLNCSISYSYIDRSLRPGGEGHGIQLTLAEQIKIAHNWIEGQSSGALCWGGSTLTIGSFASPFIPCTDIEDRANRYTYPYSWMLAAQAGFKPNGGTNGFVRKNGHELKAGERYLFDANIVENVDGTGGQAGTALSFKVTNSSSGSVWGTNFWNIDENVTATNNVIRNACRWAGAGVSVPAISFSNGGGVTLPTQNAVYANNLMYNISVSGLWLRTGIFLRSTDFALRTTMAIHGAPRLYGTPQD